MKAPPCLSTVDTQELFMTIMQNVSKWIEEEAREGNDLDFSQILSNQAFNCIALHVPTTMNDLKSMHLFEEPMLGDYGERILQSVQNFLEDRSLKEVLCEPKTRKNTRDSRTLQRKVLPALLPKKLISELELLLKELATKWAKREQRLGLKQRRWDMVSVDAIKSIAFHAPTTFDELLAIGSLEEDLVRDYGERIVSAVQMVRTKNAMQRELCKSCLETSISFDLPATPAPTVESGETWPTTPNSSFSGASGTVDERLQEVAQEIVDSLRVLTTNWAEEERILTGRSLYSWDILSTETIKRIASLNPTSMEELQVLGSVEGSILTEYGPRILAVVQSVVERHGLHSIDMEGTIPAKVDLKQLEMIDCTSPLGDHGVDPASSLLVLPEEMTSELFVVLRMLRKSWAEEERIFLGRDVHAKDVLSREAMTGISLYAPTTLEHLEAIRTVKEDTVKEYGVRIIAVVQMFLETKQLNWSSTQELRVISPRKQSAELFLCVSN